MEKPVAPPRRKYRSVTLMPGESMPTSGSSSSTPPARPLMEKQQVSSSFSTTSSSEVTMEGTSALRYTDVGSTGRPRPARPLQPPRYKGDFPKHRQAPAIPASKSSSLSRKVQQQPKGVARVAAASSSSAPSSPNAVGTRKQVHDNVSLSQFYGKNNSYASAPSPSTRRTRQSVGGEQEERGTRELTTSVPSPSTRRTRQSVGGEQEDRGTKELTTSAPSPSTHRTRQSMMRGEQEERETNELTTSTTTNTTIINSRVEQGRGIYLNVAPKPPPTKSDSGLERSKSFRRHSDNSTEPAVPRPARLEKKRVGGNTLPRSNDSSGSLNGAKSHTETERRNFSILPLPPSSTDGRRRLVPVRPAPPAPVHRKMSSRRFSNSVGYHDADYEYVNPAKTRYSPSVQNTEVRLSRELEGLDLTIYSVVDDSQDTTDVKESTSKNIYAALNPNELLDNVYAVPSSSTNSTSSASNQVTETSSSSNLHNSRVRGSGYANVQCIDKKFQRSKSFVLDTSGGQGSPSPTSMAPPIQEEQEDSVFSSVENIYMPVSKDTLDHTPVYQAVNCSRKTISSS